MNTEVGVNRTPSGRRPAIGWPWWALFVQTSIAGSAILVLFVADIVALLFSPVAQATATGAVSPAEEDDGALGLFVLPILFIALTALPTVAVVTAAVALTLPIRLIPTARGWIVEHRWVAVTCASVGFAGFVAAEFVRSSTTWPAGFPFIEPSSWWVGVSTFLVALGLTNAWVRSAGRPAPA